jgi:hypothetical protein
MDLIKTKIAARTTMAKNFRFVFRGMARRVEAVRLEAQVAASRQLGGPSTSGLHPGGPLVLHRMQKSCAALTGRDPGASVLAIHKDWHAAIAEPEEIPTARGIAVSICCRAGGGRHDVTPGAT